MFCRVYLAYYGISVPGSALISKIKIPTELIDKPDYMLCVYFGWWIVIAPKLKRLHNIYHIYYPIIQLVQIVITGRVLPITMTK